MKNIMVLIGLLVFSLEVMPQVFTIHVLDDRTGDPVPFANICFESTDNSVLNYAISDEAGAVRYESDKTTAIAISFIGYHTILDTLQPGLMKVYRLRPKLHGLDEVVVTGQYSPTRADQSIYKVQVINQQTIRFKGASNLSDVLSTEINLRTSNDAALGSSLSIQGLSGEYVKILVDGVPVIGRLNGNIDLNQLNMHNVDHVEIIEGPMSVIYGSNALAGAVNIITSENLSKTFSSQLNAYTESVGIYNFNAALSYKHNTSQFFFSGARNFFGGFSEYDTSRTNQWKPRLQYNLDAYYVFNRDGFKLKLDTRIFDETIQNKGEIVPLPPNYASAFDAYFYTTRWINKAIMDYEFSDTRKIQATGSFSHYNRTVNTYTKDLTNLEELMNPDPELHDTSTFSSVILRSTWSDESLWEKLSYQAGIDINLETGKGRRILDNNQAMGDYATFISFQYTPNKNLLFQPGFRYGYNTDFRYPLVASLNMKWDIKSNFQWRLSYAKGFRAPSLKEMFLFFVDINHNVQGNPDLKAEYSNNFQSSWTHKAENRYHTLITEAGLFFNQVNNRITIFEVDARDQLYSYINIEEYITTGGSVNFKYHLHPRFSARIGFSETGHWFGTESNNSGNSSIRWSSELASGFDYKWISKGFYMSSFYKLNGALPLFSLQDDEIVEGVRESYHRFDASVSKDLLARKIKLTLGGNNLFNYTSVFSSDISAGAHGVNGNSYPVGWGRTFYIKLTFLLSKI